MMKHICIGFVVGLALMTPYLLVRSYTAGPACFEEGRRYGGLEQRIYDAVVNGDPITKSQQDAIKAGPPARCN